MTNLMLEAGVYKRISTPRRVLQKPFDSVWTIDFGPILIIDLDTDTYAIASATTESALDDGVPTILGRSLPRSGSPATPTPTECRSTVRAGRLW